MNRPTFACLFLLGFVYSTRCPIGHAQLDHADQKPRVIGAQWPNWMGPNMDGVSSESNWSTKWPAEGLTTKWTKEIGIGFSSMSVADGRVYTMGNVGGTESVYCLDFETGEEIWRHSYPCKLVAVLYEGGPGCTPTIDGDFVYAVGKEGQLMCLEKLTGKIAWEKRLQEDLNVPLHEWGFNASPFILDDQVIVEVGRLASYDKLTGEKKWQSELHTAGYGSVRTIRSSDQDDSSARTLLVTLDCDGLRLNDAKDATEVAFEPWKSPFRTNATTPIVHNDTIFVSTGYNVGCGLFRLKDNKLEEIYVNRDMRNHFNNSILLDGYLYGFDGNSNLGRVVSLTCMKYDTGEVAWKHRGLGCGSLMIAGDKLVALSEDGRLVIAEASEKGFQQIAQAQILSGRCWTVPLLIQGHVLARNAQGKLVCVEVPK